ncbi:MAG: 2Fe-2S iron-sulfur cluster binding domain-containing protein [Chitinophagaceae bacterium]|nr:MAG: 2Fe-2S iron-sulfur cluster binding domain-containing protein [Chitinophagaceae bacterium]
MFVCETMYSIRFQSKRPGDSPLIFHRIKPGQSLLEVAIDHAIAIGHDCGGMCSCGTCHILVEKGNQFVEFRSKRELHQLAKVSGTNEKSRLACQCILLPGKGDIVVNLPNSSI